MRERLRKLLPTRELAAAMHLAIAFIVLALLVGSLWPRVASWKAGSDAERAFTVRFTVFVWLLGFLFVAAFVFLPIRGRVLMMLPLFLAAVTLLKWWKNSRARLRREAELQTNFERARRVN